jgi:predicted amidohydrolase
MPTAALVQLALTADPAANLDAGLAALAEAARAGADLAVFPELSFTPFYPVRPAGPDRLARAEPVPGPTTLRLQEAAARRLFLRDRRPDAYAGGAVAPAPAPTPVSLAAARARA